MSYYGTSVTNSASATSTGYSAQFSVTYTVSDSLEYCSNLTSEELDKLKRSMELHKESLSLLGQ